LINEENHNQHLDKNSARKHAMFFLFFVCLSEDHYDFIINGEALNKIQQFMNNEHTVDEFTEVSMHFILQPVMVICYVLAYLVSILIVAFKLDFVQLACLQSVRNREMLCFEAGKLSRFWYDKYPTVHFPLPFLVGQTPPDYCASQFSFVFKYD
jgi:hypothetical protein